MSAVLKASSVKNRVTADEWQLRVDLAAAYQLAAKQFDRPDRSSNHKDWPALLRLLERGGSNYRD